MTKKHYIDELHWLGWVLCELLNKKQDEISAYQLLSIIKEILGNDFGKADYQELLLKKSNQKKEAE